MRFLQLVAGALALNTAAAKPLVQSESNEVDEQLARLLNARANSKHLRAGPEKRQEQVLESPDTSVPGYASGGFANGQPINSANGRGGPISGESTCQVVARLG